MPWAAAMASHSINTPCPSYDGVWLTFYCVSSVRVNRAMARELEGAIDLHFYKGTLIQSQY